MSSSVSSTTRPAFHLPYFLPPPELYTPETTHALHTMNFLWMAANNVAVSCPVVARHYLAKFRDLSMEEGFSFHDTIKHRFCEKCGTLFIPGVTCVVRTRRSHAPVLPEAEFTRPRRQKRQRQVGSGAATESACTDNPLSRVESSSELHLTGRTPPTATVSGKLPKKAAVGASSVNAPPTAPAFSFSNPGVKTPTALKSRLFSSPSFSAPVAHCPDSRSVGSGTTQLLNSLLNLLPAAVKASKQQHHGGASHGATGTVASSNTSKKQQQQGSALATKLPTSVAASLLPSSSSSLMSSSLSPSLAGTSMTSSRPPLPSQAPLTSPGLTSLVSLSVMTTNIVVYACKTCGSRQVWIYYLVFFWVRYIGIYVAQACVLWQCTDINLYIFVYAYIYTIDADGGSDE